MKYCNKCGQKLTVSDSRVSDDGYVHRVRDCKNCWNRIYTIELPVEDYKQLKKNNNEAIDEFTTDIINKINFEDKWLFCCKSDNADTNIAFGALRSFVKERAEQLKEQHNEI